METETRYIRSIWQWRCTERSQVLTYGLYRTAGTGRSSARWHRDLSRPHWRFWAVSGSKRHNNALQRRPRSQFLISIRVPFAAPLNAGVSNSLLEPEPAPGGVLIAC